MKTSDHMFILFTFFFYPAVLLIFTSCCCADGARIICEFPSNIQTNQTGRKWSRDWQSRIKEQFTEFTVKIEVTRNIVQTTSSDSSFKSNSRICIRKVDSSKYLVMHEESGQTKQRYSCLQFLFRSSDVFQIRSSPLSDSMETSLLCSEDVLLLDKWLVVDKMRIGKEKHVPCPLKGGFNILVFDKSRQRGVCDAWRGEIRMESECSHGDGLTFYFRSQRCVPEDMYMYATQPTICLANWNEGAYTFSLIRHNIFNYVWLMRFPTNRQKVFTSYLFKDLFADTADAVSETYRYLRFDTIQDHPYDLTMLCRDDYEICTTVRAPCTSTLSHLAVTCPLTCGICSSIKPTLCDVNPEWIGSWSDRGTHENVTRNVNITSTAMTVSSSVKGEENFRCVRWKSPSEAATVSTSTGNMFVTHYSNGCRPRYTCARVLKQSSSLLYLEFSKRVLWPLIKSSNDTVSCEGSSFRSSDQHLLLHAVHRSEEPAQCRIPTEVLNTFQVRLRNGTVCQGNLSETKEGTGFEMHLTGCQADLLLETSFLCLESSLIGPTTSHRLVIAKTTQLLYCWLFLQQQSSSIVYLLDALHCHLGLRPNVRLESSQIILQGLLSSNQIYKSTIATGQERSFSSRRQSNQNFLSEKNQSEIQSTNQPVEVLIQPSTVHDDGSDPSPVAVVFAVVCLAILQTVLFCKC